MKKRKLLAILSFTFVLFSSGCNSTNTPAASVVTSKQQQTIKESSQSLETVEVTRVVDGDTIKINLNDEEYSIRMIGIDTPESVHPDQSKNTIYGQKASDYTKSKIEKGQTVYLQKDVSNTDKYGRLLRYVWLEIPEDTENTDEIKNKMFNALVIESGYANAYPYEPDTKLKDLFSQLEQEAKEKNVGLWAENGLKIDGVTPPAPTQSQKDAYEKEKNIREDTIYIGNKNSKIFHVSTCTTLPKEENAIYFDIRTDAIEQGYEACKKCNP